MFVKNDCFSLGDSTLGLLGTKDIPPCSANPPLGDWGSPTKARGDNGGDVGPPSRGGRGANMGEAKGLSIGLGLRGSPRGMAFGLFRAIGNDLFICLFADNPAPGAINTVDFIESACGISSKSPILIILGDIGGLSLLSVLWSPDV